MHGFSSGSSLLVNAEVDSMGGIVDSGVGISTETSPRQAAIVKTQDELRLEYDVREERRRELEFLEKGGNLLDFKFGVVAPVSVQSSSLADQLQCQFRTCEAKGSISLAASPHGDSIGSSGRKGTTVACEPNSADNFDGENELFGIEGKSTYANRSSIVPSENSSHLDGSQNVKKSENSPNLQPKKAYRRRNRSKTNRDSARSSSTGIGFNGGHKSSLSDRHGLLSMGVHESPLDIEMDGLHAAPAGPTNGGLVEAKLQNIEDVRDSTATASVEPNPSTGRELAACEVNEFPTCSGAEKPESDGAAKQLRESDHFKGDEKCSQTDGIVSSIVVTLKGLDSESSCTQTSVSADRNGNIDSGLSTSLKNVDSIEEQKEQKLPLKQTANNNNNNNNEKLLLGNKAADVVENESCMNDNHFSQNHQASVVSERDEGGTGSLQFVAEYEAQYMPSAKPLQSNNHTNTTLSVKVLSDNTIHTSGCSSEKQQLHNPSDVLTNTDTLCSVSIPELQLCDENQTKVVDKEYEERILEEARNVNAKREIMKNISLGSMPKEYRCRSHWGFVLEEMAWMANDFAQERVWKRTAATQLCYRAAFASRLRLMEQNKYGRDKVVAQTLAKAVADFWHSAALLVGKNVNTSGYEAGEHDTATSENTNLDRNGSEGHVEEYLGKNIKLAVQEYAVRFLQHNSSILPIVKDASSGTPEKGSNIGMTDLTYHNQHTEENLFYAVPHRAMEAYRKYVERYIMQLERAGKNMHEVYKSPYEAVAGDEFEENEGENTYYLSGAFEDSMNKSAQKKRSNPKLYSPRVGDDSSYGPCMENRSNCPQSAVKRHVDGLDVCPIPTKRVRTASRQRVVGPFRSGATGFVSAPCRTDASSGDTNSFQDDQITEHAASFRPKGLEVESGMDYDKQASFDSAEIAVKPKKKKKTKHQAPRWQAGSGMQIEQRNNFKKRLESHHCDSNGNSGVFGPHGKKPKTVKQLMDNSFESTNLMNGSAASPVGSQMSNMSNSNKLIKLIGGRDRGRKTKLLKMPSEQTGSGNPWSVFEDQALVVLVHDMGPNWELVSDAINSTLHFKCIFRKPKECRERHRILVEKSCGDGADIEDSGSSQSYPSTLPGIPKGGARQLFQQLRGPIEEDTIKSHFEKIMLIGRELHGRKKEPRQLVPAHSSHLAALSQVITNNLNGGVLTPLDLCDMDVPSPDLFALSPHSRGLPLPNQGAVESLLSSSTISPHHGSASAQHNGTARDGRCGIPRTVHEQQRIQQYNHALSGRSTPVSGTFSANDRGGHLLSGGNGIAMSGMNRSSSMLRTGIHGGSSSSIPSSGSVAAGQGNSVPRPHDGSHMARPGQSPDRHRQMMSSEMKMQGPHINNQGVVPAFGALTSSFPSQSASPSGSIYPVQKQQHQMPRQHSKVLSNSHHPHLQGSTHVGNTEQQALAMRLARQRMLQRQQQQQQQNHPQQFPASGALIPTALQSSSTVHSQAASQPVSLPPLMTPSSPVTPATSQQQQKRQIGTSTIVNQGGKLRQHQGQQLQQLLQKSGKHHPPQGQPSQVQQTKKLKGMGGGSVLMPKNHSIDSSHLNRVSGDPGSQLEKGDQTKTTVPSSAIQSHLSQKLYTNSAPASSKQDQRGHSHPGTTNPSQAAVVSSTSAVPNSNQHNSPPILLSPSHQQSKVNIQPSSKLVSDCQPTVHREVSQNCVTNSGPLANPQNEQREADEKKLANGTSSMSTTSRIPSICTKSANGIPLASSACSEQRETLEPTSPNAQLPSIGSPSMSNPLSNEPVAPVSQVLDAQQLSHSLGSHGST